MKKVLDIIFIFLIFFTIYFLQANFFSWFSIAGIKPNLFISLIVILGLFMQKEYGFIFGIIFGLLLDFLVGIRIGINTIAFGLVGLGAGLLDKNFAKDNKLTLITVVSIFGFLAEIVILLLEFIFLKAQINLVVFIKICLIETVFNVLLIIIIYPLLIRFAIKLENDFIKGNNILDFLY